jgi:hypothetical protein
LKSATATPSVNLPTATAPAPPKPISFGSIESTAGLSSNRFMERVAPPPVALTGTETTALACPAAKATWPCTAA